jgi:sec-independent protein translocase protein TatA
MISYTPKSACHWAMGGVPLGRSKSAFGEVCRMGGMGFSEMMVVLVIALIIFGPKKLPQLGEGLGKAIKGFKLGMRDGVEEPQEAKKIDPSAKG